MGQHLEQNGKLEYGSDLCLTFSNWSWLESDKQTQNWIIFGNCSHVLNSVECGWGTKTMFYPSLIFSFCYDFLLMIVLHVVFFVCLQCKIW